MRRCSTPGPRGIDVTELGDLVVEPADLRLLELGSPELIGLVDADLADAVHRLLAGPRACSGAERSEKAASAADTASSTPSAGSRLPDAREGALPLLGAAPLPIWVNTSWTTLRMMSSVICMADTVALRKSKRRSQCPGGTLDLARPTIDRFVPVGLLIPRRILHRLEKVSSAVSTVSTSPITTARRSAVCRSRASAARLEPWQIRTISSRPALGCRPRRCGRWARAGPAPCRPADRLDGQELLPRHRGDLLGRHHAARHPGEEHLADTLIPG